MAAFFFLYAIYHVTINALPSGAVIKGNGSILENPLDKLCACAYPVINDNCRSDFCFTLYYFSG